jgi:hypothetical protein
MIKYALRCASGHTFDAWFQSIAAYEALAKSGHLSCARCGRAEVDRAPMAPALAKSSDRARSRGKGAQSTEISAVEAPSSHPAANPVAEVVTDGPEWSHRRAALAQLRKLRDEVLAKSQYVGPRFAEEARRIHDEASREEAAEVRGIHGEATIEEVASLLDDGIPVAPIPKLPGDGN